MKLIFKNFLKLAFALLVFTGGANKAFTQTTPLEVRVTVAPPYPIRLTDFVSSSGNVFINIANPTTENYKVVITGSLKNEDRDLSISSDPANPGTSCIEVPPGGITLTGMDLAEMFDPSRLSYRNTTMDVIRGNQALPDGNYKLCLRLMDCMVPGRFLSPIPDDFSGCGSFEVNYVDPPVIIQPLCDEVIDGTRGNIPITWTWIPPAGRTGNINFHIRMVEVEPPTRSTYDAMLTSPPVFEVDVQNVTSYNLLIPDDVVLEQGRVYAFQISARDLDEEIVFERDGKGEICKFTYGNAFPGSGGFSVSAFYPQEGDVIPFSYFPFIVKYDPYSNSYSRFISDFRLIEGSSEKYSHHRDLNWPRGPLRAQRDVTGFGDITESQAQHIAVGKNQMEIATGFSFDKTKTYQWTSNVEIEEGSRSHLGNVGTVNFKVGMGPSELKRPVNGDTIPPGSIEFVWKTGPEPTRLMPDFAIVQATRATGTTFFNGIVDERWIIEVSRDDRFSEIVHTIGGRLGYNADLNTDPTIIKNELYKDLQENFTITANGKYYWRVKWMNSPDNVSDNSFYATSPTWYFIISNTATPEIAERDSIPGGCISTCIAEAITNRTASSGLTAGQTLRIGKFTLTVRTISGSAGDRFTGEGFVAIPFLNNVKILVDFTSIQFNSDGAIFAGTVKAKPDRAFATEEITTGIGGVLSMSEAESENLNGFLQDGERLVSLFSGTREIGMPIGIDREIEGNRYVIGVVNIEFSPERAIVDAVMNLNFPTIGDRLMAFGVKDLCITPSGLGDEGRLYLARDWLVVQEGETQFAFKGAEAGDTTRATYVAWDCRGFKCMQVRGEVTFPRNMVVPDNVDGTAGTGFVKGTFSAKACRGNNWIASIDFTPFQVAGLDGWGWVASNAYLDFSDLENPASLTFPRHYADSALLANPRLANTWQGFYMQVVEVRMPPEFANTTSGGRTSFGVNHIIIDKTGFSANIFARNILEVSEGNFEGWGFAIDTVNIAFVSNTFREAGMAGRIGMPIFEPGDHLKYKMALSYEEDDFAYQFRVYTRDTLNIPMWGNAKMFFKPNSDIVIGFNDPVKGDHASANLHGGIHLTGDFGAIPGLNFRGVNFEGLKLSTRADEAGRYFAIDSFYVAHASPQKSAAGFPVNIENIGLNLNSPTRPGIDFDFMLVFAEGSTTIGAEAHIGVFATFQKVGSNFNVGFGGVDVDRISIDAQISEVRLRGELEFFKADPVYGNGTRGSITVELPMNISGSLTAYFGTIGSDATGRYGTAEHYSYWFVDGMVTFPGIQIFSGFAIYGFGGGAYHHMTLDPATLPSPQATLTAGEGGSRTSVRYVPNFNTALGLKFTAVLGTYPTDETFNMDVTLAAEFNSSYGLNFISIEGGGYFMASRTDRTNSKVWATVAIMFDNRPAEGPKFTGNFGVFVKVEEFLKGRGAGYKFVDAEFYVDSETWHFYMGTPENRSGLVASIGPVNAELTSYLMVGHGIPSNLPPLPERIMSVLGGSGGRIAGEGETVSRFNTREMNPVDQLKALTGEGFAFGTSLEIGAEMNFAIFYASLEAMLGFDINVSKNTGGAICVETGLPPQGIDGWYAQGQIYAGLWGEMGVGVDLYFIKGRFPFIEMAAAVMMQGNFPNPSGFRGRAGLQYSILGGMVEGSCNFKMEIGDKCTFVTPNPLSGMAYIADILPDNGERNATCFTNPAVSFNLPVGKNLEFPITAADGTEVTRTFYPFVDSFIFKKRGGNNVRGSYTLESNNTELRFRIDEMLAGRTDYEVSIVVKAYELFPDGPRRLVKNEDRSDWKDEKTITFTTGPEPDSIPQDIVLYTYPVENQSYFLKGEVRTNEGIMQLRDPVDRLFRTTIGKNSYRYLARYIPVAGGENIELPITYSAGRLIKLPLPVLDNEKMYAVQIVRKLVRSAISPSMTSAIERFNIGSITTKKALGLDPDAGTVSVRSTGKILLPGEAVEVGEKLLYKFYFKTSKYNTVSQKVSAIDLTSTYKTALFVEAFELKARLDEPFDEFEAFGLFKNGVKVMQPLLDLKDPWRYSYHNNLAKPRLYDLHRNYKSALVREGFGSVYFTALNTHGNGLPPDQTITVGTRSRLGNGIDQGDVEREYRKNPAYPQVAQPTQSTSAGTAKFASLNNSAAVSYSAYGVLNGTRSTYSFASYSGGYNAIASLPNFEMVYGTSASVWGDFMVLKRDISRTLSFRPLGIGYPIRDALRTRHTTVFNGANRILRESALNYRYTRGTYGVDFQYIFPVGNNSYFMGSKVNKIFTY